MGAVAAKSIPRITACECLTAFGDTTETLDGLLSGQRALVATPALGRDGGDPVPLAIAGGRSYDETISPSWSPLVHQLSQRIPGSDWGSARRPVFVTSSNFGVGALHAFRVTGQKDFLPHSTPFACVDWLTRQLGWGPNITVFSHACVSAHLGILQATRALRAGFADQALVFSFDFLSPFVVGGFNALKILNAEQPAPYQDRPTGSVALGDGAAFAVLSLEEGDFAIGGQSLHNEMHHFTANRVDGAGFTSCLADILPAAKGRRLWLKGHGTGTLEAGRLEATALAAAFPESPLVAWKGSLGHTLGSCGLVELAVALAAFRGGRAPGTVGSAPPAFSPNVAFEPLDLAPFEGVLCTSNAFGGAHAALLVHHA